MRIRSKGLSLLVALIVVGSLAAHATAQTCSRNNIPICGGCQEQNLIVDSFFLNGCSNWVYGNNTARLTDGNGPCSDTAYVRFSGTVNGHEGELYQDTVADRGDYYYLGYEYAAENSTYCPAGSVDIVLENATTGQTLFNVDNISLANGDTSCTPRSISLGYHPEWHGLTLRVHIYSHLCQVITRVKISIISLWA